MTRSEFIAETVQLNPGIDVALARQMADAAERAGVTWKPEQVEPRVGERLNEPNRWRGVADHVEHLDSPREPR